MSVPKISSRNKTRYYPIWFDSEIIDAIRLKTVCHKELKRHKTQHCQDCIKQYRAKCKTLIHNGYLKYLNEIQSSISSNPKKFWTYVQTKKGRSRVPPLMKYDDKELSTPLEIVNSFGLFFNSVYVTSNPSYASSTVFYDLSNLTINIEQVTEEEILQSLKKCKDSLTAGVDNVPSFLLKDCASIFVMPLHYLFNLFPRFGKKPLLLRYSKRVIRPILTSIDPFVSFATFLKYSNQLFTNVFSFPLKALLLRFNMDS